MRRKAGLALRPTDAATRHTCLQWLMFGQYNHFVRYDTDTLPCAIDRHANEVARLHRVRDRRHGESVYLAGPAYSIADIATFP